MMAQHIMEPTPSAIANSTAISSMMVRRIPAQCSAVMAPSVAMSVDGIANAGGCAVYALGICGYIQRKKDNNQRKSDARFHVSFPFGLFDGPSYQNGKGCQ